MAQVGTNATGQPVFVGDQCTITGFASAVSGSGSTASVTVTTDTYSDVITVQSRDCVAEYFGGPLVPAGTSLANYNLDSAATNPAVSNDGEDFAVSARVSVRGTVLGYISGSGSKSQLSIRLADSQNSVTVSAGCLRSVPSQAGSFNT